MMSDDSQHGRNASLQGPVNLLPIEKKWGDIDHALQSHRNLVLVAEPGAGKTTRFPVHLLAFQERHSRSARTTARKILMLEPRRLAARAAADRIAHEQQWRIGEDVGYQVRFENKTSPRTRLDILTEGLLARRLQSDPELRDTQAVILDEFHERSVHTDLAIGLLLELQELARPDLRIIVMSATLDAERAAQFLGDCPVISVPGRSFPVSIENAKQPLRLDTGEAFTQTVSRAICDVASDRVPRFGDVLVFLPGTREIRNVHQAIRSLEARGFAVFELHGSLPLEAQNRVLKPVQDRVKIILATNIAETSLTIEGVGTVIDSGLARVSKADANGFSRLQVTRISRASATQRSGRAGRQMAGVCYRLWNKLDEAAMAAFEQPEILRSDLSDTVLTLASQGVQDPASFSWFEPPAPEQLGACMQLLDELGFRAPDGSLTTLGRAALRLPLPVRVARFLLEAAQEGRDDLLEDACQIAALLAEKDIVPDARKLEKTDSLESDILQRWHLLNSDSPQNDIDRLARQNVERVAASLREIVRVGPRPPACERPQVSFASPQDAVTRETVLMKLLLRAFPDRLCRRRRSKEPSSLMVGGRGVALAPFSCVETEMFFLALSATHSSPVSERRAESLVTMASAVRREWVESLFHDRIAVRSQVAFSDETRTVRKQTAMYFKDLPLEEPHLSRPSAEEAYPHLLAACEKNWHLWFEPLPEIDSILGRLSFLERETTAPLHSSHEPMDLSAIRTAFLQDVCWGEIQVDAVLSKPLAEIFLRHVPAGLAKALREAAPSRFIAPSGREIKIHYPPEQGPYIEVRIQEIFGLKESPLIGHGRTPLTFHLLAPNGRPVQVTSDLQSFWVHGYPDVRRELRARYPKHSWPEDPRSAPPEAKGRRRSP